MSENDEIINDSADEHQSLSTTNNTADLDKSKSLTDESKIENEIDDDLEDGEIEDDDEDEGNNDSKVSKDDDVSIANNKNEVNSMAIGGNKETTSSTSDIINFTKTNTVPTNKKSKKFVASEDWAADIQNAIADKMEKECGIRLPKSEQIDITISDDEDIIEEKPLKSRKKGKKRQKRDNDKKSRKKRKYHDDAVINDDYEDDDDEMLCIRGASPTPTSSKQMMRQQLPPQYYDSESSYSSRDSYDSQDYRNESHNDMRSSGRRGGGERRRKRNMGNDESGSRSGSKKGGSNEKRKRGGGDDYDGCVQNTRGYCRDGDECPKAHDNRPAHRKLELCKFYLMECCAKKDKCSYMHSDFPCKYYYLGMECIYMGSCKFSHGEPLTDELRAILLKHIETAPKEILGNFRRISRETALTLLNQTHAKLCAERGIENTLASTPTTQSFVNAHSNMPHSSQQQNKNIHRPPLNNISDQPSIPSLLDMVIPVPRKEDKANLKLEKQRRSRWCETSDSSNNNADDILGGGGSTSSNVLSLKNLTGVLSQEQVRKLASMGIENLEQINQCTVYQLNSLGLTINQINEIQLNALNFQKLGLIKATSSSSPSQIAATNAGVSSTSSPKSAASYLGNLSTLSSNCTVTSASLLNNNRQPGDSLEFINPGGLYSDSTIPKNIQMGSAQDVDMRFLVGGTTTASTSSIAEIINQCNASNKNLVNPSIASPDTIQPAKTESSFNSNTINYSQYLKDSNLDVEKTDLNDLLDKDDGLNEDEPELLIDESWMDPAEDRDVNRKVNEQDDSNSRSSSNNENNDKTPKPSPTPEFWGPISNESTLSKKPLYYDSNEENWDSDNDEDNKKKSLKKQKTDNDDDKEEYSYTPDGIKKISSSAIESKEYRDPRLKMQQKQQQKNSFGDILGNFGGTRASNSNNDYLGGVLSTYASSTLASAMFDTNSNTISSPPPDSPTQKRTKYSRPTIYDKAADDDISTSLNRRKCDKDMRMSFMDSSNSDVDLRFPFKPVMTNYTPATEIDGSISLHGPMPYKVIEVDIPDPDYNDIRRNVPTSEKILDPRIRRILGLEEDASSDDDGEISPRDYFTRRNNREESNTEKPTNNINISVGSNNNIGGLRADPRRRREIYDTISNQPNNSSAVNERNPKTGGTDIKQVLQKSDWYKNLNSKYKIMVNQQLAIVSDELKKFHLDPSPNKICGIMTNPYSQQILTKLGIYIDINGEIMEFENDNDGEDTSAMTGLMGMGIGGGGVMDPNMHQQMGLIPGINAQPQLANMLSGVHQGNAVAGMLMRNAQNLNMGQRLLDPASVGVGAGPGNSLLGPYRPQQRFENIRPGLLGIAPGIQFNPFDNGVPPSDGPEDKHYFNAFQGVGSSGRDGNNSGISFDPFFGRNDNQMMMNRGMRNNYRQGGMGVGDNGGGGGNNRNNSGNWRDNQSRRRKKL